MGKLIFSGIDLTAIIYKKRITALVYIKRSSSILLQQNCRIHLAEQKDYPTVCFYGGQEQNIRQLLR